MTYITKTGLTTRTIKWHLPLFSFLEELCFGGEAFWYFLWKFISRNIKTSTNSIDILGTDTFELTNGMTWMFPNLRTELPAARAPCAQVPHTDLQLTGPVSSQNQEDSRQNTEFASNDQSPFYWELNGHLRMQPHLHKRLLLNISW